MHALLQGNLLYWIFGGLICAVSAALFLWALFRDRSKGRKRCPKCWYDMSGAPSLTCPECGRTARSDKHLLKTKPRKRWAAVALGEYPSSGL